MTTTADQAVELDGFRFAMIPEAMIYSDLSGTAIKVFGALLRHGVDPARCYPSHKRLAKLCRLSINTVRRSIGELEDGGWITILHRQDGNGGQTSNGYRVHSAPKSDTPLPTDGQGPLPTGEYPPYPPVGDEREQLNESNLNETPPTPKARQERAPRKRTKVEDEAKQRGWTDQQLDAARTYVEQHPNVSYPKRYLAQILQSDPNSQPFIADMRRPQPPEFRPDPTGMDTNAAASGLTAARQALTSLTALQSTGQHKPAQASV